jgi:steroid 5-alpha reductase family enzyme
LSTIFAWQGTTVLVLSAAGVAALLLAVWFVSLKRHDASVIDPAWGPAFVVVALVAALAGHGGRTHRWLTFALVAAWGLRLGAYLVARKRAEPGEDRRYTQLRAKHPDDFARYSLVWIFGLQAVLVLVVSLPVQVAAARPNPALGLAIPGVAVFALGLAFEAIGDAQLRRFKATAEPGAVMDRGLWRYTRHPNYFGDTCVWWGLWLLALPAGGTWWTAIGPAVMTVLLVRVSGKALLERDIAGRRPAYAEYVRRTSGFIPRPPR